ncbi:hypothetical protein GLYMA_13G262566v4 [Glycine max]|nr:hypothetical protein GLYMA_13G262566v4 [Glycine max]KAH1103480.1 hypothetical protein GYH30_037434 [Glycine max]
MMSLLFSFCVFFKITSALRDLSPEDLNITIFPPALSNQCILVSYFFSARTKVEDTPFCLNTWITFFMNQMFSSPSFVEED